MAEAEGGRVVLVTGAGSGIGQATAQRLARAGYQVTGTVRDPARADELTGLARQDGIGLRYVALDLAFPDQVASVATYLARSGGLDVLVHNAGQGVFGAVEDVGAADTARQFAVNLFGPLDLTRRLLPILRARRGRVIWIGSIAGRISLPFQAHYSATKAAIASLSDAMRMELRPHGVHVTCVEPGDFRTGFTDARRRGDADESPYRASADRCLQAVERQERNAPGPDAVAAAVERLCRAARPPARLPVGPGAGTMCLLLRLLPDRVREVVVRRHYAQ